MTDEASPAKTVVDVLVQRALACAMLALKQGAPEEAQRRCSEALEGERGGSCRPEVLAAVLAERSAASAAMLDCEQALEDARESLRVKATAQGYLRLGQALYALQRASHALLALEAGLKLGGGDCTDLQVARDIVKEKAAAQSFQAKAEISSFQRQLCSQLRLLRQRETREELLSQWRQTMSAPEWDIEDYEWRPTFLPQMRLTPQLRDSFEQSPQSRLYLAYAQRVAELDHPKRALRILRDDVRLGAYQRAIANEVAGKRVIVLEAGTGVLPVLCAVAGACGVHACERSEALARMALQTIAANAGLHSVVISVSLMSQLRAAGSEQAKLVVTDMFDYTLLGMRAFEAMRAAAMSGAIAPDARIIPRKAAVWAVLLELRLANVSGFDLSAMNAYRWHPIAEGVDLEHEPHRRLSEPVPVCDIDFQRWLDVCIAGGGAEGLCGDAELEVTMTGGGVWNAVAMWFDLDVSGETVTSQAGASWTPAVYFVDERPVSAGDITQLRVRHDTAHFIVESVPVQTRPRHSIVPTWHFDMLNDAMRNDAYERAIQRAVQRRKATHGEVMVLDVGAGSGILGMLAARAGADSVVGVEVNSHMCEIAEQVIGANRLSGKCVVLQRDARRVFAATSDGLRGGCKPDGMAPELLRQADILVFEVFDSGLIGEGALHLTAMASHRLLLPDAAIIPASARVFCQPIQFRLDSACGVDVRPLNRYSWRPDYEGVELGRIREQWVPLGPPVQVFEFCFAEAVKNSAPMRVMTEVSAVGAGVLNAVAIWFDLVLDEQETLSTDPHRPGKGPTWQQAVQFVSEVPVAVGDTLRIEALHDTYSISVAVTNAVGRRSREPLCDPAWRAAHDELAAINASLVRAIVQSPLEHRAAAMAATQMASRPGDIGIDVEAASQFFRRMYA